MKTYADLSYVTPPRWRTSHYEMAYAVTPAEVVRRWSRFDDGSVQYDVADLSELIGKFEPQNRLPSVPYDAWTSVEGTDETPE